MEHKNEHNLNTGYFADNYLSKVSFIPEIQALFESENQEIIILNKRKDQCIVITPDTLSKRYYKFLKLKEENFPLNIENSLENRLNPTIQEQQEKIAKIIKDIQQSIRNNNAEIYINTKDTSNAG